MNFGLDHREELKVIEIAQPVDDFRFRKHFTFFKRYLSCDDIVFCLRIALERNTFDVGPVTLHDGYRIRDAPRGLFPILRHLYRVENVTGLEIEIIHFLFVCKEAFIIKRLPFFECDEGFEARCGENGIALKDDAAEDPLFPFANDKGDLKIVFLLFLILNVILQNIDDFCVHIAFARIVIFDGRATLCKFRLFKGSFLK